MNLWGFDVLNVIRIVVDVTLVWYVLYKLIMLIRGTKAIQLLKGIVVVLAVRMASLIFDLQTLKWLTHQAILWGFLVIIILFQPELRRALEQLGRGSLFSRVSKSAEDSLETSIEAIVESCKYMAKRRIGAIITIERETGIDDYAETGIPIGGKLTHQLLTNIFTPNTPLHDGAVIIREDEIIAAACYLPLSESPLISKDLGTRHRAAVGVSEQTDAITVIVSEETGGISCTKNGELRRDIDEDVLRDYLYENLVTTMKAPDTKFWNWRGKNNG
ncbi:MAG TPA: diadenylate cyclase CdaA [Bacillota bacterium]|nr:diadenylate cyclase CdaA [Bacillota bacterium]